MKVISLDLQNGYFYGVIETKNIYQYFIMGSDKNMEMIQWYEKKDYRDYDHFVRVMSKFDPNTIFLKKPIDIETLTADEIEASWNIINKHLE